MAIQPIDLQTLFSQLDKVGKLQMAQKEGIAIQQSLQSVQTQKKIEERVQSVDEAKHTGEGAEGVNDRNARKRSREQPEDKEETDEKHEQEPYTHKSMGVFRDPSLGKNIDMKG
ncbi:MAG: hypothetical protein LBD29_03965 [Treponema sp.]|jgi:hypothetical protein|nr:hypothetical protein [Treponema sp.]